MKFSARKNLLRGLGTVTTFTLIGSYMTEGTLTTVLLVITLVLFAALCILYSVLWRCPHCHKSPGNIDKINRCKNCGCDIDW